MIYYSLHNAILASLPLKKKKKGSKPPKHLCTSKKRHLFLRHLAAICQKVILMQVQVHKDLCMKGAPL